MTVPKAGEDAEKLGFSYTAGENVKWSGHVGNQFDSLLKNTRHPLTI